MKRAIQFVLLSAVLFLIGAGVLWRSASRISYDKTVDTLRGARKSFQYISEGSLDGVLWHVIRTVQRDFGATARPLPLADMQQLAARHNVDELNVFSSNGVNIASNQARLLGVDLRRSPIAQSFLDLLRPDSTEMFAGQPFRAGIGNADVCSKYYCMVFPDRSGLIEIGITEERYKKAVSNMGIDAYRHWKIGQYGYYLPLDANGNGAPDMVEELAEPLPEEGTLREVTLPNGDEAFVLMFPHAGMVYRAILPKREYDEQRNKVVMMACGVGGVFFLLLVAFLVKILVTTNRLDALHREVEAHTAHDLAAARAIQLSSLQRAEMFRIGDLDSSFSAVTYPAREVGGDLYVMFMLPKKRVGFVVGDVSGKGISAAMFMHVAKNMFEVSVRANDDLPEAVRAANDYLCEHNQAEMFVTAWFGVLDVTTGIVEYVNAGHNRPYVVRAKGGVERIDGKGGRFLGTFPKATYRSQRLKLNRGDRLFVFTDGVPEAMDAAKHQYGEARLVALLGRHPDDLCKAVKADVDAFVGGIEPSDDLTMLALTYHGRPERIEQQFPADVDSLGSMVEFVRGVMRLRYAKQEARLLNAVDEVLSNVVNYSGSPTVNILVENVPGRVRITITDSGAAYNPLTHRDPDVHQRLEDRSIGGLGILMAKKLVSSVKYARWDGQNVLTLVQLDFSGKFRQIA